MDKKEIKKWIMYVAFGLITLFLQEHLLSRLKIYGIHPMLGGVLTAVIAVCEGGIAGGAFGLFVGVVQDALIIGPEGFYALVYFFSGLFAGYICEYMFRKNFLTAALWSTAITSVATLIYYMMFFLLTGRAGVSAFLTTALPEIAYSVIFLVPIYFPLKQISRLTGAG